MKLSLALSALLLAFPADVCFAQDTQPWTSEQKRQGNEDRTSAAIDMLARAHMEIAHKQTDPMDHLFHGLSVASGVFVGVVLADRVGRKK